MSLPKRSLCIHGWGASPAVWQPLFGLAPPAPDFAGAETPEDLVTATVNAANELKAETVIGWSLGGMLALAAAVRVPSVRRCVLIGSAPTFVGRGEGRWSPAIVERMRRAYRQDPDGVRRTFLERHLAGLSIAPPCEGVVSQAAGLALLGQYDLREEVAGLAVSVLWLHGLEDSLFPPPTVAEAQMLLPQSRLTLHLYDGLGHAPFLENPVRCRQDLIDFFQDRDS
jgi:pimeloyl-ACP methyl ester carboxylesterase